MAEESFDNSEECLKIMFACLVGLLSSAALSWSEQEVKSRLNPLR